MKDEVKASSAPPAAAYLFFVEQQPNSKGGDALQWKAVRSLLA